MKLHKEGAVIILSTTLTLAAINVLIYYTLGSGLTVKISGIVSLGIWLLITQFFRVPSRKIGAQNGELICPADGKVVVIEKVKETEYFEDERMQISIFMSPVNVHVNWVLLKGVIKYYKYHPGKFLVAWHPKSSTENERTTTVIENEKGQQILVRQIAGAVARRIVNYMKPDQQVAQGDQLGFIKFGSRVDVFLPLDAEIRVSLDQVVKGRTTILAQLK